MDRCPSCMAPKSSHKARCGFCGHVEPDELTDWQIGVLILLGSLFLAWLVWASLAGR